MQNFDGLAKVTKTLASKSSMNPTLILAAIVVPLSLGFAFCSTGQAQLIFFAMAIAVIAVALLQIVGFSLFAPNRLDDHSHTEKKLIISQISGQLGQGNQVKQIPDGAVLIENPLAEKGVQS